MDSSEQIQAEQSAAAQRLRSIAREVTTMDCREQAKKIYELCVTRANATKKTLTYGEVLHTLGYEKKVSGHAIRYGLELVLIACADSGLPDLTAIVVNQVTGKPSAPDISWEKDVKKVFSNNEWPDVYDIDWEYVWKNRIKLSSEYSTPGYWSNKKIK